MQSYMIPINGPERLRITLRVKREELEQNPPAMSIIQRCKVEEDPFKVLRRSKKWEKLQKPVKSWS